MVISALDLVLLPSSQIACFTNQVFSLLDCKHFLYSIFGLILPGRMLIALDFFTTSDIANTDFTVLDWSIYVLAIVVLMNLCTAWIIGIDPEFGGSILGINSSAFPGMQVALFMAFGVGSIAFCRLVMGMLLHLESGLLPSNQRCCFTPPGSSFIISDLCRNKFDTNFRVVASWSENVCLKLRLFRAEISGLGPISIGYEPLFLGLNCL